MLCHLQVVHCVQGVPSSLQGQDHLFHLQVLQALFLLLLHHLHQHHLDPSSQVVQ